ncbi:hypothetical protein RDI58_017131 [Solanum bulbocastanum]
MSLNPT